MCEWVAILEDLSAVPVAGVIFMLDAGRVEKEVWGRRLGCRLQIPWTQELDEMMETPT